ncbi:MAG: ATP-binding protein, partial [Bacteroidales bacterium]|nr:ATP-binding protein [Bacteroidales bacterium]
RQHVLINILQIMQFPGDFQRAIDHALAQIGKCAGVSRAFIVEKNDGAKSVSITHQWCNVGIKPFFYTPKKISMNVAQRWFDLFEESDIRCFSDLNTLDAGTVLQLENNDVKSVAVIPLINYDGTHYGIIGFLDCIANREWNAEDIELLKSTSQIISISTQRYNAEENLLSLSRRQTILIKVLQVVQSAENHHQAMNEAIAEVGKYAQLCRVHVFEKSQDGKTYSCTYEWRDEYTTPIIHLCQKLPIEQGEPWFDLLSANQMICTSDIYSLTPEIYQMLEGQRVKAIVSLPLSIYGSPFGFINFTVCKEKVWEAKEVKLLVNISQIFTTVIRRRQVEKAMKLSQQTMRTVLDNINASILVTEYDSLKILFANDNFRQAAGENVEGMLCWQSQKSGLTAPCEHCPRAVLIDGNGIPARVHHREEYNPLTGRWHIIMSTAIKWINDQLAVMELATDITDIKLNEMELVRAREKAEESDNLKSAFLANMSHEIRTPLNAIVGFLNIIAAENMLPEREQDYFNIIKTNAAQLVQLINDIIDVAKIEARQMNISLVPVDINQLMNELHILFKTIMQTNAKRDVVLILDESGFVEDSRILADPTRLRQVLNNLINNAIKYTDEGYIRFGYRQPAPGKLEFVVEDTGAGIAPDQHEVIFERFRQAGKNFLGGTGLGLNIAQSLVHMMGGDIWVESAEGRGSTFYFTILFQSA